MTHRITSRRAASLALVALVLSIEPSVASARPNDLRQPTAQVTASPCSEVCSGGAASYGAVNGSTTPSIRPSVVLVTICRMSTT